MAWSKGQSGNPAGRKPGAEALRQYLKPKTPELMAKALEMALAGDSQVMRALLDRIAPAPRSQHEAIKVKGLAEAPTLTAKATAIADAAGRGEITPDAASTLLQALAAACHVAEFDELQRRLTALERQRIR
jgi:hypothetical protein